MIGLTINVLQPELNAAKSYGKMYRVYKLRQNRKPDTEMIPWDTTDVTNRYNAIDWRTAGWQFLWNHLMDLLDGGQGIWQWIEIERQHGRQISGLLATGFIAVLCRQFKFNVGFRGISNTDWSWTPDSEIISREGSSLMNSYDRSKNLVNSV